jgi:hypothetical protein
MPLYVPVGHGTDLLGGWFMSTAESVAGETLLQR